MSNKNTWTFEKEMVKLVNPEKVSHIEVSPFLFHELKRSTRMIYNEFPGECVWSFGSVDVPIRKVLNLSDFEFRVLYKPVEERVEKQEVELLDMDEANNAIRKFEEAMQQVKEPERLAKIAIGEKLYSALNSVDKGDVWLFEDFMDVPLQLDKSLGAYRHVLVYHEQQKMSAPPVQYPIPMPAPPKTKPITLDEETTLTNITINGIAFEDLTASVFYRNEGWQLLPAKGSDTELILFGFIKAISCLGAGKQDTRITITGQDEHKPWIEYTGSFVLDGYSFNGKHRIANASFYGIDIEAIVNEELKPSITAVFNEFEVGELIGSLINAKRTASYTSTVHINRALKHLQALVKESGN